MTALSQIESRDRRPAFYLWAAGVPVLYGSVLPPARVHESGAYQRRAAIIPGVGLEFDRRLDEAAGSIECGDVVIALAVDAQNSSDTSDAGRVFGGLGYRAASVAVEVTQDIDQTQGVPFTRTVRTTPAGLSVGDVVHLGREAFEVGAVSLVAPYSVTFARRAVMGTPQQAHRATLSGAYPVLTDRPVYFRGRRAVIFESAALPGGDTTGWVERWRGFIREEPELTPGRVRLIVAPLTAILDRPLGDEGRPVHFSRDFHTFGERGTATVIEHVETAAPGALFTGYVETQSNAATSRLLFGDAGVVEHQQTAAGFGTLIQAHPRRRALHHHGRTYVPTGYADTDADAVDDAIEVHTPLTNTARPSSGGSFSLPIMSVGTSEARPRTIAALDVVSTVRWPDALVDTINDPATGWNVGSIDGYNGGLTSTMLDRADGGWVLRTRMNVDRGQVTVTFTNTGRRAAGDRHPIYGCRSWDADGPRERRGGSRPRLPFEVFSLDDADADHYAGYSVVTLTAGSERLDEHTRDVHVARAFYAAGERWLTLESPLGVPAGGMFLDVHAGDDDEAIASFLVQSEAAVVVDGVTVYRVAVHPDNFIPGVAGDERIGTIVEHDGGPRVRFRPAVYFSSASIGEIALQLLCSSGGNAVSSATYDVLAVGAGLTDDASDHGGIDVDAESFLAIASPFDGARWSPKWTDGDSIGDVISSLLRAAGYALDVRTTAAGCRLTAIRLGLPNEAEKIADLGEADIADAPRVSSPAETAIYNVFNISANYGADGEPGVEVPVIDAASYAAFGEARPLDLELRGAWLPTDIDPGRLIDLIRPMYSRLRAQHAFPRRLFEMDVRAGVAASMKCGGVYSITHSQLWGDNGLGVSGVLVRLREIVSSGWGATARAVFVYYGPAGAGWAPSCNVTAAPDAVTVTVADQAHAPTSHPVTGETIIDIDGFDELSAGDRVRVHPDSGTEAYVELQIVAVNRAARTIEFSAAHGLAAPADGFAVWGTVAPTTYAAAPALHQSYAYAGRVTVV